MKTRRIFYIHQILQYWLNSALGMRVKDVVDRVKKWTTQGVVDVEIWKSLDVRGIVDFNPIVVQQNSGPASLTDEREYFHRYIHCIFII